MNGDELLQTVYGDGRQKLVFGVAEVTEEALLTPSINFSTGELEGEASKPTGNEQALPLPTMSFEHRQREGQNTEQTTRNTKGNDQGETALPLPSMFPEK